MSKNKAVIHDLIFDDGDLLAFVTVWSIDTSILATGCPLDMRTEMQRCWAIRFARMKIREKIK